MYIKQIGNTINPIAIAIGTKNKNPINAANRNNPKKIHLSISIKNIKNLIKQSFINLLSEHLL